MNIFIFILINIAFILYFVHIIILNTKIKLKKDKIFKLEIDVGKYKYEAERWRSLSNENIEEVLKENFNLKNEVADLQRLRILDKKARNRLINEIKEIKEYNSIIQGI